MATTPTGIDQLVAWLDDAYGMEWGLVGAGAQIGLMLLVIAFAFAAAPRG